MKKYALTLLVLFVIGIALTWQLFSQDQRLDQTVFLETTKSIRNLQALDKNFTVLLSQSRFNSRFDHDQLFDTNYEVSEEFDNLRYEALFEEIEGSQGLSDAVVEFEDQFLKREEELEAYVEGNSLIAQGLNTMGKATQSLSSAESPALQDLLGKTNAAIFALTLGGETSADTDRLSDAILSEQIGAIRLKTPGDLEETLSNYRSAIGDIVQNLAPSAQLFDSLGALKTGPLLDAIEDEYTNYHNLAIVSSNRFRNALIIYGLVLLAALLVFAYQIRKNYQSLEYQVEERTREIATAYENLQESQEQLIQSEKMASLGQMVAGVAHEVNTPLGYVTSNVATLKSNVGDLDNLMQGLDQVSKAIHSPDRDTKTITQRLVETVKLFQNIGGKEVIDESKQLLDDGAYGLEEMSKLVGSLKDFARLDRQTTEKIDVHDCLESALTIASNHIRSNNVTVKKSFGGLPTITCSPSKLNQLFLNIITNACQAMSKKGGELRISTEYQNNTVKIVLQDQGIGMDDKTQQKMFDPFFTSKDIGEGTGLGMSIAYKIVEAHKGQIDVLSAPGKGTRITVSLPVLAESQAA